MCGRFIFVPKEDEQQFFDSFHVADEIPLESSYNIAPTQLSPVVTRNSPNKAEYMHWGLIPNWAKDKKFASKMINARIETLNDKPAYRGLIDRKRCLIPASGYYEWGMIDSEKHPFLIQDKEKNFLAMGGLFDLWISPEGEEVESFTIITQPANNKISHIHERMPLLIDESSWDIWLDPKLSFEEAFGRVEVINDEELKYHQVSRKVNSPANNSKELLIRIEEPK